MAEFLWYIRKTLIQRQSATTRIVILVAHFILLFSFHAASQNINIRILAHLPIDKITFTATSGKYDFITLNSIFFTLPEGEQVTIYKKSNHLRVSYKHFTVLIDSTFLIRGNTNAAVFELKTDKLYSPVVYNNDLYVQLQDSAICLINDVDIDKYIAGVVEAEGGPKAHIEYYKAQAILCRSYAARFYQKHIHEGYNLCDGVHCQAYKGTCKHNPIIYEATLETTGMVLTDTTGRIASAVFYANSGGQTVNSEDMWNVPHYYLRSKPDPFSVDMPGYMWEKSMKKSDWEAYLISKGLTINPQAGFVFLQENRKKYLEYNGQDSALELKIIRQDLKLRSTFFSIEDAYDNIVFKGKGYGHGVGLSQEGAMNMALKGYNYKDIIEFYFPYTRLSNMQQLNFYRVEQQ